MDVRMRSEQIEKESLSSVATLSANSKGRKSEEAQCPLRTIFQRDRDRIIHCKAFRRLKQKTQVFLSPTGDHYRTRLTHTLEVSQIGRTIARALRLNEDLTEAIALGHDLGHTPFGHAGERTLNELNPNGFKHNEQSVRVVECLEKDHQGLNLSYEVLDGMACHTGKKWGDTPEACIVRYADRIAYLNHDIEDAITAKVLCEKELPSEVTSVLGSSKNQRITTLITSLVEHTNGAELAMDPCVEHAFLGLRSFMFAHVYTNKKAKSEEAKAQQLLTKLYDFFLENPGKMPRFYRDIIKKEGLHQAVTDYLSGMSDDYAIYMFETLYLPKKWTR